MKILQVNCVYGTGSTGKIVRDLHRGLSARGAESVVCYGRGARSAEPGVYKTCGELYAKANNLRSRLTGLMYGGCALSTARLIAVIRREKPDVVHLHCINGYFVNIYRLLDWLKRSGIRTVLTLHAEFPYTANCGHAFDCEGWRRGCGNCPRWRQETKSWLFDRTADSFRRMQRAFEGFDLTVVSVSPWLRARAESSPMLAGKRHEVILNGIDTGVFYPHGAAQARESLGVGAERKLVLHVTASFSLDPAHVKGGWYVAELARRMPDVTFAVVGARGACAELPENVVNVGRLEDQDALARLYSAADAALLTSRRETFSMVAAESLCCGTPIVGFRAGGPESIALPEGSTFVGHDDLDGLESALRAALARPKPPIAPAAAAAYGSETMCEAYWGIYGEK